MVEIDLQWETPRPVLAVGAHQHNTLCLLRGDTARISDEHGDLDDPSALRGFLSTLREWDSAYLGPDGVVACDLHPGYPSTIHAHRLGRSVVSVQHHASHAAAVAADAGVRPPFVAVVCDGTGLGADGAVWGGEILHARRGAFTRSGHLRSFWLPGGDVSAHQPWRAAAALVNEAAPARMDEWAHVFVDAGVAPGDVQFVRSQLAARVNVVRTTSVGRLFDGVAFLTGACKAVESPGQAPILLERVASPSPLYVAAPAYPIDLRLAEGGLELDWHPLLLSLMDDVTNGAPISYMGARFHAALGHLLAEAAFHVAKATGCDTVVLGGGCFLNRLLKGIVTYHLRGCGIEVATPSRVSSGDAGISLGQAVVAARMLRDNGMESPVAAEPFTCPALT